jgi:predicted nucleic acid-binding Zn ribbon protein
MIVESKWLINNVKPAAYTTCSKCGGESKRISSESIPSKYSGAINNQKERDKGSKF